MTSIGTSRGARAIVAVRAWALVAALGALAGCGDDDGDGGGADGGRTDASMTDGGRPVDGGPIPGTDGGTVDGSVDGGPPNARLEGMIAEVAGTLCGAITRCCDAASQVTYFGALRENERLEAFLDQLPPAATLTEESCTSVMTQILEIQPFGDWVDAARAGRVGFVESELDACIAQLEGAACGPDLTRALFDGECLGYGPPGGGESQRRMFARTQGPGAACEAISDGFGGGFYGSCDPDVAFCCYPRPDGTCGLPTSAVRAGTCAAVAPLGEACATGTLPLLLCATGQYCNDSNVCVMENNSELTPGAQCATPSFDLLGVCPTGTYCDLLGTRACEPQRADGQACGGSDECLGGVCSASVCATDATCHGLVDVSVEPATATLATGATRTFVATVTGATDTSVTWSVREADCGSITAAGVYTAPARAATCTVVATSVAEPTATGTATVTVTSGEPVVVSVSPETASLEPGATRMFMATVMGTANTAVTWTVEGTGCGSIASDGTYTAPASTFGRVCTVRATSVADTSRSATGRALLEGVFTLAGTGSSGNVNGVGTAASFTSPFAIAWHPAGFFLVTEGANRLRRVDLDGTVSSVTITGATINDPRGIVVAESGTVYVAQGNHVVLAITGIAASASGAAGVAEVLAGAAGTQGDTDAVGAAARFRRPVGLAFDVDGSLLVAEANGHRVRRIQVSGANVGEVTTVAGTGSTGFADGPVATTALYNPWGIAVASDGLFVAGQDVCVRRIAGGNVARVAGLCQNFSNTGNADGPAADARFQSWPRALAPTASGTLLIADTGANLIRRLSADRATVSTVAGVRTTSSGTYGGADGALAMSTFASPTAIVRGPDGAYYVVDNATHRIRRLVIAD